MLYVYPLWLIMSGCGSVTFKCNDDSVCDQFLNQDPEEGEVVDFGQCDTGIEVGICEADVTGMNGSDQDDETWQDFRGVSLGTQNAYNFQTAKAIHEGYPIPQSYTKWLKEINANYVMIPVAMIYDGPANSETISLISPPSYPEMGGDSITYTYEEAVLSQLVYQLKNNSDQPVKIAITLNLEPNADDTSLYAHTACRWLIGRDEAPEGPDEFCDGGTNWFWDADSAAEQAKIDAFWDSYILSARTIIQQSASAGATPELIVLGAETDYLFRTDAYWEPRIRELIQAVRSDTASWSPQPYISIAYSYDVFARPGEHPNTRDFFTDEGLDFVGLTSYFPLFDDDDPDRYGPHTRCTYENRWTYKVIEALGEYYVGNTLLPVIIMELGIPNATEAPFEPEDDGGARLPEDYVLGAALVEDGDETQANDLWGYFRARNECNDIVIGQFLWDNQLASESDWNLWMREYRKHGVRRWTDSTGHTIDFANDVVAAAYDTNTWVSDKAPPEALVESLPIDSAVVKQR